MGDKLLFVNAPNRRKQKVVVCLPRGSDFQDAACSGKDQGLYWGRNQELLPIYSQERCEFPGMCKF